MHIPDDEIHLWITDLRQVDAELLPSYRKLMTAEEQERNQRYRFEEGRFADCVTRALARETLSRYTDVAPEAWRFSKGEHGKPEVSQPALTLPLRFNLSHTKWYVVCAVGLNDDLGVDIECIQRNNEILDIAERYFSSREVTDLFALREDRQEDRFFDYWTLKEAYMKASGEGILLGLGNFSFLLPERGGRIDICFSDQLDDNPDDWRFWLYSPVADHRLAVALRAPGVAPKKLRLFETVPLTSQGKLLLEATL